MNKNTIAALLKRSALLLAEARGFKRLPRAAKHYHRLAWSLVAIDLLRAAIRSIERDVPVTVRERFQSALREIEEERLRRNGARRPAAEPKPTQPKPPGLLS